MIFENNKLFNRYGDGEFLYLIQKINETLKF